MIGALLAAWRRRALARVWLAERLEGAAADSDHFEMWCAARDEDASGRLPARQSAPRTVPQEVPAAYGDPREAGWSPLHEACYLGNARACASLCRRFPDMANQVDARGASPLRALFLYNDTAPGWRHPGPLALRERFAALPSDGNLLACALSLLSAGAKLRGGELCAAAHLGLPGCAALLASLAPPQSDRPDGAFPAWALTRAPLAEPVEGASLAVACALGGSRPESSLPVALACPVAFDGPHARAMVRARRLGEASRFVLMRPSSAQDALEELCDEPALPPSPADDRDEQDLAALAISLGADPWTRSRASRQGGFSTPWAAAASRAKLELARACARAREPAQSHLDEAARACRQSPWPEPAARQAFLAWIDQLSLENSPEPPAPSRSGSGRRL